MGVDGPFFGDDRLLIERSRFARTDLSAPFNLGRRFDLVQCLEVAEHLPRARSESLVADLVAHADVVLFSAAPPGQGGANHVNEQPYTFWRTLFAQHGYAVYDCLRPRLQSQRSVPYWYKYNMFLYAKETVLDRLNNFPKNTKIPAGADIEDVAPILFRIRKVILRRLPARWVSGLAAYKAGFHRASARR